MHLDYFAAPVVGWIAAGSLKFLINSVRAGELAWNQIGYGGLPSTHTAIVSTTGFLIAFREGISSPAFGLAMTLAFVIIMDAVSLRRHIGDHSSALNTLMRQSPDWKPLRERIGHKPLEIGGGLLTGLACACALRFWS